MLAALRRQVFEPLYHARTGSPRLAYWRELERTQYLSRAELEEIQWRRLRALWDYLWQHNSFYRNRFDRAGLQQSDLQEPADIRRLPILTKAEIRRQHGEMISAGYKPSQLLKFSTGGSTGKALDIFITEECSELRNACARRHDRWTGWQPGEPIGAAWGNPKLPDSVRSRLIDTLVQPMIYIDTMNISAQTVRDFASHWTRKKPTMLFGHAHSLYLLARELDRLSIDAVRPAGILSTSMMLLPHERSVIEEVFSCSVTDRYGCEEVSLIASECERHEGMHLNIEHLVIEFIDDDGDPVGAGEPGRIIVTDLMNMAMPFVRYQVEDVGVPLDSACPCGRGLPLMGSVTGRVADFLVRPDGSRVAGISLIENTLTKFPGIDQLQIIQEDMQRFTLNLVPGTEYSPESGRMLVSYMQEQFGNDARIDLHEIAGIAPEKSGKYRFSICKLAR